MQLRPLCTPDVAVKGSTFKGEASPIRCKLWSCPVCSQINRARVIAIARNSRPRALLTLTVSSRDYPDADRAAEALKRGLRLMRLRLKRHPRLSNFQFLAVFERHKSGHPHLHLLIRGEFLPWRELRTMWEEITGSYMVDIRKINSAGLAALYCAKYIGKDLAAFPGCKRWWRSHGYSEGANDNYQPDRTLGPPTRYLVSVHDVFHALRYEGFTVERSGPDKIQWTGPPDYPGGLEQIVAFAQGRPRAYRSDR